MVSERESLCASLRWHWHFGRLRAWKCWMRLGHTWDRVEWTDKHGELVDEEFCSRCRVDRHTLRLMLLWGIPVVWRVSFRIKHGNWGGRSV